MDLDSPQLFSRFPNMISQPIYNNAHLHKIVIYYAGESTKINRKKWPKYLFLMSQFILYFFISLWRLSLSHFAALSSDSNKYKVDTLNLHFVALGRAVAVVDIEDQESERKTWKLILIIFFLNLLLSIFLTCWVLNQARCWRKLFG